MFEKNFMLGAATAAHQVEGNNVNSDCWALEHIAHSSYDEPSGAAVDHYHHFREDIDLLAEAGLNSYRFSLEWARIEPQEGSFDEAEIEHYRQVLRYCHEKNVIPIVTMHHFSSPKWLTADDPRNPQIDQVKRMKIVFHTGENHDTIHCISCPSSIVYLCKLV